VSAAARTGRDPDEHHIPTIFAGLMLGMLIASLSQTIVAPALPRIVAELGGLEHYSWIAVSALLASAVTVPIAGKLSDLYGRKPFYVGGIVLFTAGSLIAGLAPSFEVLIVSRVVQGIGMGTLMPLSQAIIGDIISPRERGKYQGLMGAVFGLSSIVGPLVGGTITDNLSWRWLFFLNLPIAALALGFIVPFMHLPHVRRAHRIDVAGIVSLSVALTSGLLATVWGGTQYPWDSWQIIGLYGLAAVALVAFVAAERRAEEPVLPLGLWRNPIFTFSNLAGAAVAMGMFGAIYFIPVFLQGVTGASATNSGALLIPMSVSMIGMSIVNGQLISRTGRYKAPLLAGLVVMAIGFWLLTLMGPDTSDGEVIRNMVIIGLGLGTSMQTFTLIVQNAVGREVMGVATSATQLSRSIGSTVGIAVLGTVMAQSLRSEIAQRLPPGAGDALPTGGAGSGAGALLDPSALASLPPALVEPIREGLAAALHTVFLWGLPFPLLALAAALFIREIPLRRTAHADRPAAEEAGLELLEELGQAGPEEEPRLEREELAAGWPDASVPRPRGNPGAPSAAADTAGETRARP